MKETTTSSKALYNLVKELQNWDKYHIAWINSIQFGKLLTLFPLGSFIRTKLLGGGTFLSPPMIFLLASLNSYFFGDFVLSHMGPLVYSGKVKMYQGSLVPLSMLNLRFSKVG